MAVLQNTAHGGVSVAQETSLHEATWPRHQGILYHLDLVPFIPIVIPFNAGACFKEASALLDCFVEHRYEQQNTDGGGKWKSLGIRTLGGDPQKTREHEYYGVTAAPAYRMTQIAELCPETTAFLMRFTDPDRCHRIRFMLLEPGAVIKVHSDGGSDKAVSMAFNIALNMPEGCDFFIDTNPDGTHNAYTRKIPFAQALPC